MDKVDRAAAMVKELADAEANIIGRFDSNETFGDEIRVTVVIPDRRENRNVLGWESNPARQNYPTRR